MLRENLEKGTVSVWGEKGKAGLAVIGNYENKILNLTALNYSKSHGPEGVIGREVWSLSVQLNNYLVRTSEWTLFQS